MPLNVNITNVMFGNIYNQILLHLAVLRYDCLSLDTEEFETSGEFLLRIRDITQKYQSIVKLNTRMRAATESSSLAEVAFIYKDKTSDLVVQKELLTFMQMTQKPLTIRPKPIREINFEVFITVSASSFNLNGWRVYKSSISFSQVLKMCYQFTAMFKNFSQKYAPN